MNTFTLIGKVKKISPILNDENKKLYKQLLLHVKDDIEDVEIKLLVPTPMLDRYINIGNCIYVKGRITSSSLIVKNILISSKKEKA